MYLVLFCVTAIVLSGFITVPKKNKKSINTVLDSTMYIKLGQLLFYDPSLSFNNTKSCGSCHNPNLYFTDGYKQAIGLYGDVMERNTPSVINVANFKTLNWANPNMVNIATQMLTPLFNTTHAEMGMQQNNATAYKILSNKQYSLIINNVAKNWQTIITALALYQKKLISRNSKYDYKLQNKVTFTTEELTGEKLFFSKKMGCNNCHAGQDFNTPINPENYFSNTGLNTSTFYADSGMATITKNPNHLGKFRIPSLRNVAQTAPYYHNGSAQTLTEVIKNYAAGGKHNNPIFVKNKSKLVKGFAINNIQIQQLISFLNTLTDTTIKTNPLFTNPYNY